MFNESQNDDFLINFNNMLYHLNNLKNRKQVLENSIVAQKDNLKVLKNRLDLINRSKIQYKKAVDNTYTIKITELENLLNTVVSQIYYDKDYSVKIALSDKYNKSLSFWLYDKDKDLLTPLSKSGTGRGIKTVVSSIIYIYYLLKFNAKYVFIDEGFVNIDSSYVDSFFIFLKEWIKSKNATVILNTHDERFDPFADAIYTINDGIVNYEQRDSR